VFINDPVIVPSIAHKTSEIFLEVFLV